MLAIYRIVIVQKFGGEGRYTWFWQRWREVWRGPKKPLVHFWRLPLQSDFEKPLIGNSIGGYRGSTGGGWELFLEVLKVEKWWKKVTEGNMKVLMCLELFKEDQKWTWWLDLSKWQEGSSWRKRQKLRQVGEMLQMTWEVSEKWADASYFMDV